MTSSTPPLPRGLSVAVALLVAATVALIATRAWDVRLQYIIWSDRDLWRSARLFQDFPVSGAELSYANGARVPGGFWHWMIGPALAWRGDPVDVQRMLIALDGVAALVLGRLVWRQHGAVAGALAMALYASDSEVRRTLTWLWNPSALPIFLVASQVFLVDLLETGRRRSWFFWGLALALGGHAHMTALAWLASTSVGLVLVRRGEALAGLRWAFAAVALAYAPYFLVEAATGWPNSHAMMDLEQVRRVRDGAGWTFSLDELRTVLHMFTLSPSDATGDVRRPVEWIGYGVVAAAWIGALSLFRPGPRDPARDALRVLAVGLLTNMLGPVVDPEVKVENRYALAALPALSTLAAVSLARGASRVASGQLAQSGLAVGMTGLVVGQLVWWPWKEKSFLDWQTRSRALARVDALLDGDLAGVAGRTLVIEQIGDGWRRVKATPVDYLLAEQGSVFPGSLAPPCAALFGGADPGDPAAAVGRMLGVDPGRVEVISTERDLPGTTIVVYRPPMRWCPTTFVDRYIDLPREADVRPWWGRLSDGEVIDLPGGPGRGRAVHLDNPGTHGVLLVADAVVADAGVSVTLTSNQLRGNAFNGDWFDDAVASDVALHFVSAGAEVVQPVADSPIGLSGVVLPLTVGPIALPPGTWRVTLDLTLREFQGIGAIWPFEPGPGIPRSVVLFDDLLVR